MKKIKNLFLIAIFSLIMSIQTISASAVELSELESGIYEISNEVHHEQEIGMNMARTYLDENMTLEKTKGKWYYTVKFSGTNYMKDYRVYINDKEVDTEIVNENTEENTIELKFKTDSITPDLSTKIYVDAMERDVEFDIIPNEETLNLVEVIEETVEEEPIANEDNKTVNDTQDEVSTSNEKSSNKTIFIGIGVVLALAIIILVLRKLKK